MSLAKTNCKKPEPEENAFAESLTWSLRKQLNAYPSSVYWFSLRVKATIDSEMQKCIARWLHWFILIRRNPDGANDFYQLRANGEGKA